MTGARWKFTFCAPNIFTGALVKKAFACAHNRGQTGAEGNLFAAAGLIDLSPARKLFRRAARRIFRAFGAFERGTMGEK